MRALPQVVLHEGPVLEALEAGAGWLPLRALDEGDVLVVGPPGPERLPVLRDEAPAGPRALRVMEQGGRSLGPFRVRVEEGGEGLPTTWVPRTVDVFDRVKGLLETDALAQKTVGVVGLGSGGSFIVSELAKAGVGGFVLVDGDRLEVGNVCRHLCDLADIGRRKTLAMRDAVLRRNPQARVQLVHAMLTGRTLATVREALSGCDVLICATDNRESRLLMNRVALQLDRPTLFGGVFRRAYGGQVLVLLPGLTPCYQCFVSALPDEARDQEVASATAAAAIAYSDRPVAIEPGLSSDILPIGLQMVKLALVHLMAGMDTTLASLRQDLVAPWFLWINRREPGTSYAGLEPLEDNVDGLSILRWYGIFLERQERCPACAAPSVEDLGLSPEELAAFGSDDP